MKTLFKILVTLIIMSVTLEYIQAQNLVPNPNFEDTITCPQFSGTISYATGWQSFSGTPEYLNGCAPPPVLNVPSNNVGYQYANSGTGMAGLITYAIPAGSSGANYREHIGIQLVSPLIISEKYFMSFYINYSGYGGPSLRQIACNKIGLKLTMSPVLDSLSPPPLNNSAHLFTDSILTDTVNWYKVSGSFIADSTYQFVVIGNFFDSVSTDTIDLGGTLFGGAGSYHYIDDVCVTSDSLFNELWTGLSQEKNNQHQLLQIYPNPASNKLYLEYISVHKPSLIQVVDINGKLLIEKSYINEIDISSIPSGIYFIKIQLDGNISRHKFIKN